mgnify:CR=1 FL=1
MAAVRWLALLTLVIADATWAAPARRAIQWERVTVSYNAEDEAFARTALEAARTALSVLEDALGLSRQTDTDQQPIRIEIARRQADFDQLVGQQTKPWVQAIALGDQRRIVLKTLLPAVARTVVAHELTHLLLDEMAREVGAAPPRWLHEGLAKLAAGDFTEGDREVLGRAAVEGRLLRLDQLEPAFEGNRDQVALAYAQSYTLVNYLHELHPGGGIREYLQNLALTGDADRALLRTYGRPPATLEQEWLAQTTSAYLKHGLPLSAELAILGAMALLAAVAFAVQGRRRRLIRERLQEEERLRRIFAGADAGDAPPATMTGGDGEPPEGEQYLS